MSSNLAKLFNPSSIAIVGASRTPGKIGHEILKNLINGGYQGKVYPVNPKADRILGLKCYPDISSIDDDIDLAVICIPAVFVPSAIEECGHKGVKFAIIISSGFSETGNRELENEVVKIARKYGVRIIGPNCAGIICSRSNLYATFEPIVKRGNAAFISQSGALGGAILYQLMDEDKGLDIFVSIGNRADLTEIEIMEYLGKDPEVKAILVYIEGLREGEGRAFMNVAMKIVPEKPVIVLKAGTSKAGMRAVQSHTGSIAGSDLIYTYAFKQAGVIKVDNVTDALDALYTLSTQPIPNNGRVAIITNSGGPAVIAADHCEKLGLHVAPSSGNLKDKLSKILPPFASLGNPIDMTAQAGAEEYGKVLELVIESGEYDIAMVICVPPFFIDALDIAKAICEVHSKYSFPIIPCFMAGSAVKKAVEYMSERSLINIPSPERASKSAFFLYEYGRLRVAARQAPNWE